MWTNARHTYVGRLELANEGKKSYPPQPIDLLENLFHMKTDNKFSSVVILLSSFFVPCLVLFSYQSTSQYIYNNGVQKIRTSLVVDLLVLLFDV